MNRLKPTLILMMFLSSGCATQFLGGFTFLRKCSVINKEETVCDKVAKIPYWDCEALAGDLNMKFRKGNSWYYCAGADK